MKEVKRIKFLIALIVMVFISVSCRDKETPMPKPKGYVRLDLPEHHYRLFDTTALPFQFLYSEYAQYTITPKEDGVQWIHLEYPRQKATLEMTYFPLKGNVNQLIELDEEIVMMHYSMASDVNESFVRDEEAAVYGKIFDISGKKVASPLQFWLSDSTHHYLRSSLYFHFAPNNDSIQPVIDYLREDAMKMIETFKWK